MRIILLRHSESISNKKDKADSQIDSGLTAQGKEDAQKLISKLKNLKIDLFIISPLKRNLQTIQPFLSTINKPKVIVEDITLERNLGDFTGSEMGAFQRYCDENKLDKVFYKPENGESIADTYERAKKFLRSLKKYSDKTILVCGHKNFLMCLEVLIKGEDIRDYYNFIPLKNSEIREFEIKI
ncbi:MAG: histidine phosphatase family protein [archaeon]